MEHMVYVLYPPRGSARTCAGLREVREGLDAHGGVAWISLTRPTPDQVRELAAAFQLPQLAVDDAIEGGQRSKLENYGQIRFLVLRFATPGGDLADGYVFAGKDFVIFLHHDEAAAGLEQRVAAEPGFHHDSDGITYLLLDAVVDTYEPVVERLGEEIDDAEDDVFAGASGVAQRLHEHLRNVLRHQRAIHALAEISEQLMGKKIASWAAILFTPTVIAGIYGMNFHHMPELATRYGYPAALTAMLVAVVCLYVIFKRQGWL